jgi:hypothetical protein
MAEPKTEVERRLDRIEEAVSTMAAWLVSAQTGFGQKDMEGINDILYGRGPATTSEGSSSTPE